MKNQEMEYSARTALIHSAENLVATLGVGLVTGFVIHESPVLWMEAAMAGLTVGELASAWLITRHHRQSIKNS